MLVMVVENICREKIMVTEKVTAVMMSMRASAAPREIFLFIERLLLLKNKCGHKQLHDNPFILPQNL